MDVGTFDEFVAGAAPGLLRFAYVLTDDRDLAEDLVQDAFVKVHRRWNKRSEIERPTAYMRRIVTNNYLSWRRRRSSAETPGTIPESSQPDVTNQLAERDLVWRLIAELPRRQRAVLVLRFYEDLSDDEVASVLGCARATVRSLSSRAFKALRAHPQLSAYPAQLAPLGTE